MTFGNACTLCVGTLCVWVILSREKVAPVTRSLLHRDVNFRAALADAVKEARAANIPASYSMLISHCNLSATLKLREHLVDLANASPIGHAELAEVSNLVCHIHL